MNGIAFRKKVYRGQVLYSTGGIGRNLFVIHAGYFKTTLVNLGGDERVVGFHMTGDILGLEDIARNVRSTIAVALEDSEIIEIQLSRLIRSLAARPDLLQDFLDLMSNSIAFGQSMMLISQMRAEQRFASFLCNVSHEHAIRGYSSSALQLRMSRDDIGSLLGLTNSSISRLIAKFRSGGLIEIHHRNLRLLNMIGLRHLANGTLPWDSLSTK